MANIFNTPIRYITATEVKDTTKKAGLIALTDDEVNILIAKAEMVINNYLGYLIELDDTNRDDFKIIAFYVTEKIFENGDLIKSSDYTNTGNLVIKSENVGDRTIVYDVGNTITINGDNLDILGIPIQAKAILNKYKNIFFKKTL